MWVTRAGTDPRPLDGLTYAGSHLVTASLAIAEITEAKWTDFRVTLGSVLVAPFVDGLAFESFNKARRERLLYSICATIQIATNLFRPKTQNLPTKIA
jgi:hypothetical protein